MRIVTLALLALFLVPAWASEPGQPLDCTDMVLLEAGLTCTTVVPFPCGSNPACEDGSPRVVDNDGNIYWVRRVDEVRQEACAGISGLQSIGQLQVIRSDGANEQVIAYIEDRCGLFTQMEWTEHLRSIHSTNDPQSTGLLFFDDKAGHLYVPLQFGCNRVESPPFCHGDWFVHPWLARIEGLTTTFEVLQTYTSATSTIGLRVPYMPEGFQYADYFDTYWGDLATVGDWSQAQPLQCGYPATAPSVGDYLTVEDTLPSPAPGRGYYYVTAVEYMGQRRYGRQSNGGVLSGRDPAVLPACQE